ncbi:MAG: ABC transporter permease subunit, partial [Candidatus Micrarchaeota archaeon]|nr:ABC transporter permease subunit [Candidatus Micrarchaeota archaeon]
FFPFVIAVFTIIEPPIIGVNAAVVFLIITSMLWNMIFGVYEAIKTLPSEFFEVTEIYHFDFWSRVRRLYIPAAYPRLVEQSILSWAIGLFYLVTSEIFSTGNKNYTVAYGIGSELVKLGASQNYAAYILGIVVFVVFVILTRLLFFKPLEEHSTRYLRQLPVGNTAPTQLRQVFYNILERGLKSPYVGRIRRVTKDIRIVKRHPMHLKEPQAESKELNRLYILIVFLLAAFVVYIIASNHVLLSDELQILPALAFSFVRVWSAFLLISLIAIPLCIYLVFIRKNTTKYLVLFQVLASIPATIVLPLIVQGLHSNGEAVAFVIFFLSGLWYVVFGIIASTRTLPPNIFEVQRIFGIKGKLAWKNIYIKAIIPGFITGALTGIAAEWNASIVAEYFTATGITGNTITTSVGVGIGKLLDTAISNTADFQLMELALLNLVVMILILNTFVWKRAYRNVAKVYG